MVDLVKVVYQNGYSVAIDGSMVDMIIYLRVARLARVTPRVELLLIRVQGWGSSTYRDYMNLVSASAKPNGTTTLSFTIQPEHCNQLGNLHGGCAATVFDICTTTALVPISKPEFWAFGGVSRTLNVTYLRPVAHGETVLIESEVVHAGKRLCTIKGVMKRKRDGAIMVTCEHGKVNIDPEVSKL
ncbi:hypothetical protein BP6252_04364 [Coleophoma cylindrospora]|uniref:Thioesterase domain-containing protein n=1 Tax=Coleophoma cylindrospora TaxID=1849047 RepID=A0A3D8S0B5_9HELO|nr:hypothetical protein BP6252_04364 [Coleophoma cylindrospora]